MRKRQTVFLLAVLALSLALAGVVLAQSAISRSVMGGGGEVVSAGSYILNGTLGEPVVSNLSLGTNYSLCSGFWCGEALAGPTGFGIYLPIVMKNH